jgi:hypothetical protein
MGESGILAGLTIIAIAIVGALVYMLLRRPERVIVYNQPAPARFETHHWGYAWRPWWRRYNGIPGVIPSVKPAVKPPKPIIISKV